VKGNLYAISPFLLFNKEIKSPNFKENENIPLQYKNDIIESSDYLNTLTLERNHNNETENKGIYYVNTLDDLQYEYRKNELTNLYQVENYKKLYAYKDTSKLICPYDSSNFKKVNYLGNSNKINNMGNPYKHSEYSPNSKKHHITKDYIKKHSEEMLRLKHHERGENKKTK